MKIENKFEIFAQYLRKDKIEAIKEAYELTESEVRFLVRLRSKYNRNQNSFFNSLIT
ncbi:MAG: hypothetical protein AAF361_01385 [Bacteroidota bacterium]